MGSTFNTPVLSCQHREMLLLLYRYFSLFLVAFIFVLFFDRRYYIENLEGRIEFREQ